MAPGHPLLDALVDVVLERFQPLLSEGAVMVDDADPGTDARLLVYLEHAVRDGGTTRGREPHVISQRLQFHFLAEDGTATEGGPAPYLDFRPATAEERAAVEDVVTASWLSGQVEQRAMAHAIARLVPKHLAEVRTRRLPEIDKVEREVRARLMRERDYWDARAARLREEERAGKVQRLNARNAEAFAEKMVEHLHRRQAELDAERRISALPPQVKGALLVIPSGLLRARIPQTAEPAPPMFPQDALARAEIEAKAMAAVMAAEARLGHAPRDVSAEKKGWGIESRDGTTGRLRFLEVKGRHEDGDVVILTKNEVLAALNAPDSFILAIVRIAGGSALDPVYIRRPPFREPGFAESHVALKVADLLSLGASPS